MPSPGEGAVQMIAVDWGTSSFRAWCVDGAGAVLEQRRLPRGILSVEPGGFAAVAQELLGDWLAASDAPVLMCGMVGSRQGWVEAPYIACPTPLAALAGGLLAVPGHPRFAIVPGLSYRAGDDLAAEVMRGEETQLIGLPAGVRLAVLPGTHSKWAVLDADGVRRFATYMTGELFDLLRSHSILGRLMPPAPDTEPHGGGFALGLGEAFERPDFDIAAALFGVRTRGLMGDLPAEALPGYLSGLLIGGEVRHALTRMDASGGEAVAVVGTGALAGLYTDALQRAGVPAQGFGEDLALQGLLRLGAAAGLIRQGTEA